MSKEIEARIEESSAFIAKRTNYRPGIAIILGSGLGPFADEIEKPDRIKTDQIPHYPVSTVEGHSGSLVFGKVAGKDILCIQGRVHYYEGYRMPQVTYAVRLMKLLGIGTLCVTNAAGGLNPMFSPGDLMIIQSQINWFFQNPLAGSNLETFGPRFPDMCTDYDPEYSDLLEELALEQRIPIRRGTYLASSGPSYETRAEVKMFKKFGADAVGMSTVPEVIVARHQGLRVAGVTCITNLATGISRDKLDHSEVTETALRVKQDFESLLRAFIVKI